MRSSRAKLGAAWLVGTIGAALACGPKPADPGAAGRAAGPPADAEPSTVAPGPKVEAREPNGWIWDLPRGLSRPPAVPEDNPMTAEKVALGHRLFMDKRLSVDGSRSCYSCHQNQLGAADGRPKALGAGDKPLTRNTPTIWNVGYRSEWYWDGRAKTLEAQMLGAWAGGNMGVGKDNLAAKAAEVGALEEYRAEFEAVFGLAPEAAVTPEHVAAAVSAYQRTLLCGDTAFDRGELDLAARRGWDLFRGKAQCVACHYGEHFTDDAYHAVGVGLDRDGDVDLGRADATKDPKDEHKFRTPSLRNVGQTAPYFHDGSVAELEQAVRIMASGGVAGAPAVDPLLTDKGLTDAEIADIVAFLRALDCPGALEVIGDQSVPGIDAPAAG